MLKSALASLALFSALAMPSFADEMKMQRTINLAGHGEVRAAPDLAMINLGVFTHSETAQEAVKGNSDSMAALLGALTAAGIADKDVQTSNFMVNPRYEYNTENGTQKAAGFDASNQVTVTVRKLDGLGAVLDAAVKAGSNQINGISFGLANPEPVLDEARKLAVQDAARKARLLSAAAGVALGDVLSINESGAMAAPQPMFSMQAAKSERAADVPIAQGEQVMSADVMVSWGIK